MLVKELIAKLQEVDPDMLVMGSYDGGFGTASIESAEYMPEYRGDPAGFWINLGH